MFSMVSVHGSRNMVPPLLLANSPQANFDRISVNAIENNEISNTFNNFTFLSIEMPFENDYYLPLAEPEMDMCIRVVLMDGQAPSMVVGPGTMALVEPDTMAVVELDTMAVRLENTIVVQGMTAEGMTAEGMTNEQYKLRLLDMMVARHTLNGFGTLQSMNLH